MRTEVNDMSKRMSEKQLQRRCARLCDFMEAEGWSATDGLAVLARVVAVALAELAKGES